MKFEVVNRLGDTVMSTEFESCVYDLDDLTNMYKAGYRFKVDGKFVSLGKVLPTVKASSVKTSNVNKTKSENLVVENSVVTKDTVDTSKNVETSVETEMVSSVTTKPVSDNVSTTDKNITSNNDSDTVKEMAESNKTQTGTKKKYIIRCKETGQTWDKQIQAAEELGITPAQVSNSIKTGKKRSGYTFERVEI